MKTVCPICGTRKANRRCKRRELAEICPLCCAGARDAECGGCAHYTAAQTYRAARSSSGALPDGHFITEINPEVKRAREFLANMAAAIGKDDGVDLDTYLESQDAFNHAFDLMEQGDWEEALAGFRAAAARNDRNAPTHGNIGLCLANLGRKAEALKELDRAMVIDPRYEPAKFNRVAVERMVEGKPMEVAGFERIEFSKQQVLSKREGGSWSSRFSAMRGRKHEREGESDDRT